MADGGLDRTSPPAAREWTPTHTPSPSHTCSTHPTPNVMQFQPALRRVRNGSVPDQSVFDVYSAWLKQNPQFTDADVRQANVM